MDEYFENENDSKGIWDDLENNHNSETEYKEEAIEDASMEKFSDETEESTKELEIQ